jgi:4-aminobutyrate---pyruvate transaminase
MTIMQPVTMLEPHTRPDEPDPPHVIVRGEGVRVWDANGQSYLDAMAGLWCVTLGYGENRLVRAAAEQMARLPFYGSFNHRTNDVALALADDLAAVAPIPMGRTFFANSGSEANDSAIKFAWYYHASRGDWERTNVLSHHRGYHGSTTAAASATGLRHIHHGFSVPLPRFLRTHCPDPLSPPAQGLTEQQFVDWLVDEAEQVIVEAGPRTVAAFIAEPILGAGGLVIPPGGYYRQLQEMLDYYGILLVADEVITGMGRTGSLFASVEMGMRPDLITLAKGLSSAYLPISAVMVSERVHSAMVAGAKLLGSFGHGFTYSGHPVAAAVARETLAIIRQDNVLARVRQVAPVLANALDKFRGATAVRDVRSYGLLGAVEFDARTCGVAEGRLGRLLIEAAAGRGVLLRAMSDTVVFAPPLVSSAAELEEMVAGLVHAYDDVVGQRRFG